MARQYAEDVAIVGVASRDTTARFEEFVDRHDLHHVPHIADTDGEVWQRFGIVGQPAWVFVDGDSGETEVEFGPLGADGLVERFERSGR